MTIGERIKQRREYLKMSQEELAHKLGYKSRSSINKIELGANNLTQSKIKAIADALETTPSYIMGWEDDSSLEPKEIMARNIKRLMQENGVNSTDVCNALGFKAPTFSDWVNGKTYPRIDKIEMMANYFGVMKSDLIEDQSVNLQPVVEHISQSMDTVRKVQRIATTLAGAESFDTSVLTHPNVVRLLDTAQDATQDELLDAVSYLEYQKTKR